MNRQKKTTVLVYGDFNLLHPGHIRFLRFASDQGHRLIVGVLSQKISAGAELLDEERLDAVRSLSFVAEAELVTDSITDLINRRKPDVIVKGKEHEGQNTPEIPIVRKLGIKMIFSSGATGKSDSEVKRYKASSNQLVDLRKLDGFFARKNISTDRLAAVVTRFSKLKVCVVGDLIVDEYISCEPLGMSQEDPTIVVTPVETTQFLGGAGIVAAHAAALGAEVTLLAVTGKDAAGKFAHQRLDEYGVKFICPEDPGRPTTVKQRYRCAGKTVFRISHLREDSISVEIQSALLQYLMRLCAETDVLIFSDFNYGVLTKELIQACGNLKWKDGCVRAADSQISSQIGDLSKYQQLTAVYATEHEARVSLRDKDSGLVVLSDRLMNQVRAENLFLKLGPDGALVRQSEPGSRPDIVPSLARNVLDTAGAGDSFLAASALAIAGGAHIWEAAAIGNAAAAIQVSRIGNVPITSRSLSDCLKNYR
jgi:rfaE bifunctional protein kinase chain/domain